MRKVLRVADLKEELRQEVKDTLRIIDSDYTEGVQKVFQVCVFLD